MLVLKDARWFSDKKVYRDLFCELHQWLQLAAFVSDTEIGAGKVRFSQPGTVQYAHVSRAHKLLAKVVYAMACSKVL